MIRLLLAILISAAIPTDAAEARRRKHYRIIKIVRAAPPPPEQRTIRIIPISRWQLWCERIGGLECPNQ